MSTTNLFVGMGRLANDPEVSTHTKDDGSTFKVARYRIAIDRIGSDKTDFISCKAFNKLAEIAEKNMNKGMLVTITGRIQTDSYEKDGIKHFVTEIIVTNQDFASPPQDKADKSIDEKSLGKAETENNITEKEEDDIEKIPF